MTLPFRRRHNDAEASHDRARALMSEAFTQPLAEPDAAWLAAHLEGCHECRVEHDAYLADSALLRGLRDRPPVPPRDLWARTAAAIEAEASGRRHAGGRGRVLPPPGPRRIPLGVLAGALVALVVVGTALLPHGGVTPLATAGSSAVAIASGPVPTELVLQADRVAWVQRAADGTFSLVFATVDHACPAGDPACAPLADSSPAPLALAGPPQAVVLSPTKGQIAVVGSAPGGTASVLVVTVPTPRPTAQPGSSPTPVPATPTLHPTASTRPAGSTSPAPTSDTQVILSDATVVGAVGYSLDGEWLAFSARPNDGSSGPDLYLWHVGDAAARRVTTDGETFFSGWYGNLVVASGVVPPSSEPASPEPGASTVPSAEATSEPASPLPASHSLGSHSSASASPGPSGAPTSEGSPAASPEASATPAAPEAHPYSFLLDPWTDLRAAFAVPDAWLPAIDPTGRFVTYWSGTVTAADAAAGSSSGYGQVWAWRPASGHLVLDGWSAALAPLPSPSASPSAGGSGLASESPMVEPTASQRARGGKLSTQPSASAAAGPFASTGGSEPSGSPSGSFSSPGIGPTGTPIELAPGPISDFDAHFDPSGRRLAIWILDAPDASAGRLWLVVLDPDAGGIDANLQPMAAPGVQALRGFTIDTGRLAWASPAGQDGQPSSVKVLAWSGDDFGQVQSVPGGNPQIVR